MIIQLGITLLLINLDNITTVNIGVSIENAISNKTLRLDQIAQQTRKTRFHSSIHKQDAKYDMMREEYHLTAKDGDLHSQTMLLNGEIIYVHSSGLIPPLVPRRVNSSEPITVAPYSILFAHIPSFEVPACK